MTLIEHKALSIKWHHIFYICAQSLDVRIAQTSRQITIHQLAAIQQLFRLALHGAGAVAKHQGAIGVFER